jgi:hypothetical protein
VLLRLAAIAGFAFAGWIALSALNDSAFAAERPPQHAAQAGDQGSATLRHFTGWRTMTDDVREIGDHPMRYVRSRQRDLFDDKDRALRQVRGVADAAGLPRVRVPDVRSERPVLDGRVHRVTDARSFHRPAAVERPEKRDDQARQQVAEDPVSAVPHVASTVVGDQPAGDCSDCHRAPAHAPVLPPVQDGPQGGSAGGPLFPPVADLSGRRSPAAPAVVDAGGFGRTALTDVAAPGGPSVVPD